MKREKREGFFFEGSKEFTIGVEIELQIIDPASLDLTPQSAKILQICASENISRVKSELHQSVLEIDSEISRDVKECLSFLKNRILQLHEVAGRLGLQLGATGTHPFQLWPDRLISNDDRYQMLYKKYQWLIRRMNVYGLHVHVGVPTGDQAVEICQQMIRYLPILLALSANSPFWQGIDTGMQSSRINMIETFPFSGVPPYISSWKEFETYYNTLYRVKAISSFKDLYWFVRPNPVFGTIELRICDTPSSLSETMAIAALIHCLVIYINDGAQESDWSQELYWISPENQWNAARDGLDGILITDLNGKKQKISEAVLDLVEKLSPIARSLNCLEELLYLKQIVANGNGAEKQRRVFNKTESLKEVVLASQKELLLSFLPK